MPYTRKTKDVYLLFGYYPETGWEELTAAETFKEIRQNRKDYRENDNRVGQLKIKKTREKI